MSKSSWLRGYRTAIEEVKTILKNQPFMTFNFLEQYSIRPIITSKERDSFLREILEWALQDTDEKQPPEVIKI